jgi:hypothetical protein
LLYLFGRTEDVMDLLHVGKKINPTDSIEEFDFSKWATNYNKVLIELNIFEQSIVCKSLNLFLIYGNKKSWNNFANVLVFTHPTC